MHGNYATNFHIGKEENPYSFTNFIQMTQITDITVTSFKKLHQTYKNILLVKFTQRYLPT